MRAFAAWWLRHKPFNIPHDALRFLGDEKSGITYGVTVYRSGQFQVQMWIVGPGAGTPAHSHPNIDSVEYGLVGDAVFESDRRCLLGGMLMVAPGETHTAHAGKSGGAFFSIQKWLNGVQPSSVELDWVGAPIDPSHQSELIREGGYAFARCLVAS